MKLLKVCPQCYRSYPDITLTNCVDDGAELSEPFPIPLREDDEATANTSSARYSEIEDQPRARANAKSFVAKKFPELSRYKLRSSRMWEEPEYRPCWWFGLMEDELTRYEYFVFAGALDRVNRDFKLFKVPAAYIRENLSKLDKTPSGWINVYIHMRDFHDIRNDARLPFKQFAVN
jgi:hypothetical protein